MQLSAASQAGRLAQRGGATAYTPGAYAQYCRRENIQRPRVDAHGRGVGATRRAVGRRYGSFGHHLSVSATDWSRPSTSDERSTVAVPSSRYRYARRRFRR